ncbi:MAG: enoyl-CoA hydratase [Rhodospirillaceae bacterium]|jgi:enoyl-CoA hydratase/carnithine racemase|nr:enoyl-CoA hydratase [Rhodospirillaceae bacterium]MBT4042507.1 enoyl-CoA hydratase [Rhodospirillaceae bacterium]MBT5083790.1 enoyl-CoA hydratase [Rhodospirillaceae bacterium]MBT5522997.1 enoyl-CoA hydratase [Rhodospirillaceae bacterium]MBT5880254.1 enoyl-CoA hydratase [Rhodospirillaceae bacterium]
MQEAYETLLLDRPQEYLLQVTINRPDRRNAMNTQVGRDLLDLFTSLLLDPADHRAVILTGAGEQAFCAGGDLKERDGMTDETWRLQHAIFEQAVYNVIDCPVPVIAAVNGSAFGGGCEIALAADFIYASSNAKFAVPEITLGIIPGCGGTQNLPRAAGSRRAKEILFTGSPFTAQEGLEWGIVNKVVEQAELLPETLKVAARMAGNGPLALRQAKRSVNLGMGTDLNTALGIEVEAYNRLVPTEDRREGVLAFNEKRKARFKGR